MQTTLLGLAIAFIIALIAALVGPYFIDWNQFRPQFEAEATRIIGRPSREIEAILGYPGRAEMVHRDDMALSFAADPDRLSAAG